MGAGPRLPEGRKIPGMRGYVRTGAETLPEPCRSAGDPGQGPFFRKIIRNKRGGAVLMPGFLMDGLEMAFPLITMEHDVQSRDRKLVHLEK